MRKIILVSALSFAALYSIAQCNQTVTYFSGKAIFMDSTGKVERSEEGKVIVKVSPTSVKLMHNDDDNDTIEGVISGFSCNWNEPFKNGKTIFDAAFMSNKGEGSGASVTIEGKEGKQEILINFKSWGKTIKLEPDRYKID